MGQYRMLAIDPDLIPAWPPLHEATACARGCRPVVKANCACCDRLYQWCTASAATIRAICAQTWTCEDCHE